MENFFDKTIECIQTYNGSEIVNQRLSIIQIQLEFHISSHVHILHPKMVWFNQDYLKNFGVRQYKHVYLFSIDYLHLFWMVNHHSNYFTTVFLIMDYWRRLGDFVTHFYFLHNKTINWMQIHRVLCRTKKAIGAFKNTSRTLITRKSWMVRWL